MPNDFSNYVNMEDFAQIPVWAKSQARDPKVTRALVSTSTERSELLRSLLKSRHLVHCYAKPGFGLEPWLTRFLATLNRHDYTAFDISKLMQSRRLNTPENLIHYIKETSATQPNAHTIILVRLDRLEETQAQEILIKFAENSHSHTLILTSSISPPIWLAETRFFYELFHLGENLLSYTLEDYERLTVRWPNKPSLDTIESIAELFEFWPEPCLRSLCDLCDGADYTSEWLAGHQWISTYIYSLSIDHIQILLTAHALPVITPEGLDLCDPQIKVNQTPTNSIHADFYDSRRQQRSKLLSSLCSHLILQQFTHPRLHFRWSIKSMQTVLTHICQEQRQLKTLGLMVPRDLSSLCVELCKLYMEHDYIQEIIELCAQSQNTAGLTFLMSQQPGRVIDYLRGTANTLKQPLHAFDAFTQNSNNQALELSYYFKAKFYWSLQDTDSYYWEQGPEDDFKKISNVLSTDQTQADLLFYQASKPIWQLMSQYESSRDSLSSGHLADGLVKMEQVFLSSVDERCFSVAAPCIALIGLTDFFCINKKHLRKILQSIDHAESLLDPETNLSIVDWTDTCVSPLQIISSHGQAIARRITARLSDSHAGKIPEEAFLYQEWIRALTLVFSESVTDAQQHIHNTLTRLTSHFRQLQEAYRQEKVNPHQTRHWPLGKLRPSELLKPWTMSFLFLKLLNDIQIIGRPSAREAQNALKQYEQYFVIIEDAIEQKDMWHMMKQIITAFLLSLQNSNKDNIHRLEQQVKEAYAQDFRLLWLYGSLFLSAALWNSEQENEALDYFYAAIEYAETNALQDVLTPLTELLHPQIRRAKQKNKAILLVSRALEKIERKNHRKNNRLEQLSRRELEILTFINQGMSNEDIAEHLCRAKGTVKLHVHNIYKKLAIRNRVEAIQVYNQYVGVNA